MSNKTVMHISQDRYGEQGLSTLLESIMTVDDKELEELNEFYEHYDNGASHYIADYTITNIKQLINEEAQGLHLIKEHVYQ